MKKIKLITLGCDKNLVDSENIAGGLSTGYEISPDFTEGHAVIVNTCGFIGDAKKESIQTILESAKLKKEGKFRKLYVTGCLYERYLSELENELPEVDGFFRLKDFKSIMKELNVTDDHGKDMFKHRIALENDHIACVMISDGCDRKCSYCAIPSIRGAYRSRKPDDILCEIEDMKNKRVSEIVLIGQEISSYGKDLRNAIDINRLIREVSDLCGNEMWIRLLYTHPPALKESFIKTVADCSNICNYIDFPLQHTETEILKSMNRGMTTETVFEKINRMRSIIPDICIRTTIITGFPGETRKMFNSMLKNIEKLKFDRLGVFPFSFEEGTKAYSMKGAVTGNTALKRAGEIMELQREISNDLNRRLEGSIQKVLIDRTEDNISYGRTYRDAADVDCEVIVNSVLEKGSFYDVEITGSDDYDLYGRYLALRTRPS